MIEICDIKTLTLNFPVPILQDGSECPGMEPTTPHNVETLRQRDSTFQLVLEGSSLGHCGKRVHQMRNLPTHQEHTKTLGQNCRRLDSFVWEVRADSVPRSVPPEKGSK